LRRENERLRREVEQLRRQLSEQTEEITEKEKRIQDAEKQIADLERQLAGRKQNSTNSSKPPFLRWTGWGAPPAGPAQEESAKGGRATGPSGNASAVGCGGKSQRGSTGPTEAMWALRVLFAYGNPASTDDWRGTAASGH